jgi:hypothetical protein
VTYAALSHYIHHHGRLHLPDAEIELFIALPQTALNEEDGDTTVRGVRSWMEGAHTWRADGAPVSINVGKVTIATQVAGALFDYLLDENGKPNAGRAGHFKRELGIISIGMNTVELLGVRNKNVIQAFTRGDTLGVRRLLELCDPQRMYTRGELDAMLRSGNLDTSDALGVWAAEVAGMIEQQWGRAWRRFAAVIAVGGGALLLRDMLIRQFNGKAVIPEDPVMAIANGLYKYAARK